MDWNDINRIRTSFSFWSLDPANLIGTIEGGDGELVAINHAPSARYFSPRDPVIRTSYIIPGRKMLGTMIRAWIEKSRERDFQEMPRDFVPVFPSIFEGCPVRYYYQEPRDPIAASSRPRAHDHDSVTQAEWDASNALAERFCQEFWKGPGYIAGAVGPVTICDVSGYGLNAARDTPIISVTCVRSDDPNAPAPMRFPREYGGLSVEYRALGGREL